MIPIDSTCLLAAKALGYSSSGTAEEHVTTTFVIGCANEEGKRKEGFIRMIVIDSTCMPAERWSVRRPKRWPRYKKGAAVGAKKRQIRTELVTVPRSAEFHPRQKKKLGIWDAPESAAQLSLLL